MKLKKLIVLIMCVWIVLILDATKVKAEEDGNEKHKKDLIKYIKNETNLNDENKLLIPCVGVLTSKYGYREIDSPTASKNHKGIDVGAQKGTDILASHSGTVLKSESIGNYGKCVVIQGNKYTTIYAHCSKLFVSQGEDVVQGQKIAEVGSTGNATGNHLHFEVIKDGKNINPEDVIEW